MSGIIETFLLSMTPIGELRLAIPLGLTVYKLNWALVYFIAVIGNLVPAVLLLLFLKPITRWLSKKSSVFRALLDWWFKKTRQKTEKAIKKHGVVGLMLFVAFPLPVTGAWTGCLAAYLFNIPFKKSFPAVIAGVLLAGVIVSMATVAGVSIEKYFGWITLVSILFIALVAFVLKFKIKNLKFN